MANHTINWNNVVSKDTAQKRAFREIVEKFGNCNQLSIKSGISRGTFSNIIKRKITSRKQNLMWPPVAGILQKVSKIKGIAARMCPSAKEFKKN